MVYKRLSLELAIRVIMIGVTIFIMLFLFNLDDDRYLFFTQLIILVLCLLQIYSLYHRVNVVNKVLRRFFESIHHSDYTIKFDHNASESSVKELYSSLNAVVDDFNIARTEQMSQLQFFEYLVENTSTGIICIDQQNCVKVRNSTALTILGIEKDIDYSRLIELAPIIEKKKSGLFTINKPSSVSVIKFGISKFNRMQDEFTIITLEDISYQVQQKENEAWVKLMKILSHEIRNSVTPIHSMADTMATILGDDNEKPKSPEEITREDLNGVWKVIRTVKERAGKLNDFVNAVLHSTKIPEPNISRINLYDLTDRVVSFMKGDNLAPDISIDYRGIAQDTFIKADAFLLEQILINLIKNSYIALEGKEDAIIRISTDIQTDRFIIIYYDNGCGIPQNNVDNVFVPFFTTTEGGTGLGLTICRQFMNAMDGSITTRSEPGSWTRFLLSLPLS